MTFDELSMRLRSRSDVFIGAGVDCHAVADAEQALGVVFPPDLREYLMRFGYLGLGHFELYGLGVGVPMYLDLVNVTQSERQAVCRPLPDDLIPLLNDGAGNLYCVGVGRGAGGKIFYWEHDGKRDQEPEEYASTMLTWIAGLLEKLG